jgi:hypothetical protein
MNAPYLCKLRKDCLNKTPPFCHFLIARDRTKSIAHFPIAEVLNFRSLGRRIYNSKLRNEKKIKSKLAVHFHLRHLNWLPNRMSGGQIFLKNLRASLFNDDLSNVRLGPYRWTVPLRNVQHGFGIIYVTILCAKILRQKSSIL